MPAPPGRGKAGKILQKASNQTRKYYNGWVESDKQLEKKTDLYGRAIKAVVLNVKKKNDALVKVSKIEKAVESDDAIKAYYEGLLGDLKKKNSVKLQNVVDDYDNRIVELKKSHSTEIQNLKTEHKDLIGETEQEGLVRIGELESELKDLGKKHVKEIKSLKKEFAEKIRVLIEEHEKALLEKDTLLDTQTKLHEKELGDVSDEKNVLEGDLKAAITAKELAYSRLEDSKTDMTNLKESHRKELKKICRENSDALRNTVVDYESKLKKLNKTFDITKKVFEKRLQAVSEQRQDFDELHAKRHKRLSTGLYLLTIYFNSTLLGILSCVKYLF